MPPSGSTTGAESTTAPLNSSASSQLRAAPRKPGLLILFPQQPGGSRANWRVGKSAEVGRARDAHLRLDDTTVSRRHARLAPADNGLLVADLGSQHGTFVNGQRVGVGGQVAVYGSVLRFGNTLALACEDISQFQAPPRRIAGAFLGLQRDIVGGPLLSKLWQQATHVADLSHPVLIQGETGSGKEAVARLIHALRKVPGPFVALNLPAVAEGLFESELFGHVRGSFTGATTNRDGAFRRASGGVLFIDEIADLRMNLQVKLLRALDEQCIRPVGSDQDISVSTRVVAASSQDLAQACVNGSFRRDLYYRLAGVVVRVPSLRERRSDILELSLAFLATEHPRLQLSVEAAQALLLGCWDGNVRELHHALARSAVSAACRSSSEILLEDLPQLAQANVDDLTQLSAEVIERALEHAGGNASLAAKNLGVSRSTLYNVLKREGIAAASFRANP